MFLIYSLILEAIGIKSYSVLPHVGHTVSVGLLYKLKLERISFAAITSLTGSSARDTLIVSPIPSYNRIPKPIDDLTNPLYSKPASVMPICIG